MKMVVIGGGNIGTLMAAEMAFKGHQVTMCTSRPEIWEKRIEVYDSSDKLIFSAELENITADVESAIQGAEMVWITVPAQMFTETAEKMCPYIQKGQHIVVVPGTGGAEFVFQDVVKKGGILLGLQRVHSIARLKEKGKSVYMLGKKKELKLAAIPTEECVGIAGVVENLFDIPCTPLPNYMSVTLTLPILSCTPQDCM
ncbi:MAG: NAD(P)-binding domain-containing protein [Acetatifactor sp.]|nr:NAD(P)-binding domain-containing protein [Acetatifactor sp.]